MTLDEMRNEQAAQEYEEWDNQESFKVGWDACLKALIEMGEEFDEQDCYRSLGYDSEKEPAVKHILDGARWAWSLAQAQVWTLKAEIKRLNDKYDFQLLVKRNEELEAKLKEAEGAIEEWAHNKEDLRQNSQRKRVSDAKFR